MQFEHSPWLKLVLMAGSRKNINFVQKIDLQGGLFFNVLPADTRSLFRGIIKDNFVTGKQTGSKMNTRKGVI